MQLESRSCRKTRPNRFTARSELSAFLFNKLLLRNGVTGQRKQRVARIFKGPTSGTQHCPPFLKIVVPTILNKGAFFF